MKVKTKNKFKHNAKTTIIKCIKCNENVELHRCHSKYCGHLCCVHDGNDKLEKGYTRKSDTTPVFEGNKEALKLFLQFSTNPLIQSRFKGMVHEIESALRTKDMLWSWKLETYEFRLDHFPNRKKNFEIYINTKKLGDYKMVLDYKKRQSPVFKNCDLEE